jgi:uncharacterized membrane protein
VTAYAIALVTFAVIDAVWISLVATNVYRAQIGPLLADQFNLPVAGIFYLGYVAGLVHFGVQPLDPEPRLGKRMGTAALFGLFTYGTWALTGVAVLRDFPLLVAVTDIAWGAGVCALVTAVTTLALGRLGAWRTAS